MDARPLVVGRFHSKSGHALRAFLGEFDCLDRPQSASSQTALDVGMLNDSRPTGWRTQKVSDALSFAVPTIYTCERK